MVLKNQGGLIGFLKYRGCMRYRGHTGDVLTHLMMDGGKIVLPDGLVDEFQAQLAADLTAGKSYSIVEKRSDVFRMHLDLDFESVLSERETLAIVAKAQSTAATYYEGAQAAACSREGPLAPALDDDDTASSASDNGSAGNGNRSPLSGSSPLLEERRPRQWTSLPSDAPDGREMEDDVQMSASSPRSLLPPGGRATPPTPTPGARPLPDTTCIVCAVVKRDGRAQPSGSLRPRQTGGLHVIFPFLHVNEERARWIRAGIVYSLAQLEWSTTIDWNKAVDLSVLTSSGLRLVGNDKARTCPQCKNNNEDRTFCGECSGKGSITEGKIYYPWTTVPQDVSLFCDLDENFGYALKLCSVRLPGGTVPTPDFLPPTGAPGLSVTRQLSRAQAGATDRKYELVDEQDTYKTGCAPPLANLSNIDTEAIQNAIQRYHPAYRGLLVKEVRCVKRSCPQSTFLVHVRGYGSRFCLNKGADHTSQGIYFVLKPSGIAQKCWSRKEARRTHGLCEDFCSEQTPISASLRRDLFGIQERIPPGCGRSDAEETTTPDTARAESWVLDNIKKEHGRGSVPFPSIKKRRTRGSQAFDIAPAHIPHLLG
jgi:hypothetical protein